ncbi:hypothetical protein JB92DRAFT_54838 [Gautieria morchelliformis]|nr:hypothetical protein JB92DRAFT_54838 [Gautieria morchelliformis]
MRDGHISSRAFACTTKAVPPVVSYLLATFILPNPAFSTCLRKYLSLVIKHYYTIDCPLSLAYQTWVYKPFVDL